MSLNFLVNAISGSFIILLSEVILMIEFLGASFTDLDLARRACTISLIALRIVFFLSGDTLAFFTNLRSAPGVISSVPTELFLLNYFIIFPMNVPSSSSSSSSSIYTSSSPFISRSRLLFLFSYLWRILCSFGFLLGALLILPSASSMLGCAFFNLLSLKRNSFDLLKTPSRILVAGFFCSCYAS